jgi:ribosomal protein L39E
MNNKRRQQKKNKLSKANKRTNWAPIWVVLKKFGAGKRVHPSAVTNVRRQWRRTKLKIKPRIVRKRLG